MAKGWQRQVGTCSLSQRRPVAVRYIQMVSVRKLCQRPSRPSVHKGLLLDLLGLVVWVKALFTF